MNSLCGQVSGSVGWVINPVMGRERGLIIWQSNEWESSTGSQRHGGWCYPAICGDEMTSAGVVEAVGRAFCGLGEERGWNSDLCMRSGESSSVVNMAQYGKMISHCVLRRRVECGELLSQLPISAQSFYRRPYLSCVSSVWEIITVGGWPTWVGAALYASDTKDDEQ